MPLHQPEHFSLSQVQGSAAQALLRGQYLLAIFTGLSRMSDAPRPARPKIWRQSLRRPAAHDSCAPLSTLQRLPNLPEEFAWLREQHRIEHRAVRRPTAEVRADAAAAYSRLKAAVEKVSPQRRAQLLEMRAVHGLSAMNKFVGHLIKHEDDSAYYSTSEEEAATEAGVSDGSAADSSSLALTASAANFTGSGSQSSGRASGRGTATSRSPRR